MDYESIVPRARAQHLLLEEEVLGPSVRVSSRLDERRALSPKGDSARSEETRARDDARCLEAPRGVWPLTRSKNGAEQRI